MPRALSPSLACPFVEGGVSVGLQPVVRDCGDCRVGFVDDYGNWSRRCCSPDLRCWSLCSLVLRQPLTIPCSFDDLGPVGLETCHLHVVGCIGRDAKLQRRLESCVLCMVDSASCVPLNPVSFSPLFCEYVGKVVALPVVRSHGLFVAFFRLSPLGTWPCARVATQC